MRISNILESQEQLDELNVANVGKAVGSAVGKTAQGIGAVAGGVKGAWDAAKAGFQQGKGFVSGQRIGATDAKSINQAGPQGTAPAQNVQGAAGTAMGNMDKAMAGQKPAQAGATLYAQVKKQINKLDPQSKAKLLTLVQKSIQQQPKQGQQQAQASGATDPAQGAQQPAAQPNLQVQPGGKAPAQSADATARGQQNLGFGFNNQTGVAFKSQEEKDAFKQAQAQQAATPAQEKPVGKTAADNPQLAALKGRLQAKQGMAAQTGGGFQNYVAGSGERFQGADAQGNPVFKKIAREGTYQFESKFLGGWI